MSYRNSCWGKDKNCFSFFQNACTVTVCVCVCGRCTWTRWRAEESYQEVKSWVGHLLTLCLQRLNSGRQICIASHRRVYTLKHLSSPRFTFLCLECHPLSWHQLNVLDVNSYRIYFCVYSSAGLCVSFLFCVAASRGQKWVSDTRELEPQVVWATDICSGQ